MIAIRFLWLVAVVVEVYFLLNDISIFGESKPLNGFGRPGPIVAELVNWKEQVQIQAPGDLVWFPVERPESLRARQTLMTLDDSSAEISFLDGGKLSVDQNSMVQFQEAAVQGEGAPLELVRGALRLTAGSRGRSFKFQVEKQTWSLESPSDVVIRRSPSKDAPTIVSALSAGTRFRVNDQTVILEQGDQLQLNHETKKAEVTKSQFELYPAQPSLMEVHKIAGDDPLEFRWEGTPPIGAVIQVRQRAKSQWDVVAKLSPESKSQMVARLDASGEWVWRMADSKGRPLTTEVEFTLRRFRAPKPLIPLRGSKVEAEKKVFFSWSESRGFSGYEVEFRNPASMVPERRKVLRGTLATEWKDSGDYQWRVRGYLETPALQSPWSEWMDFKVIGGALKAPELLTPEFQKQKPSSFLRFWKDLFSISSAHAEDLQEKSWDVRLRWKAVAGAERYRVQVSRRRGFDKVLAEKEVNALEWDWPYHLGDENSLGRVFFRVAGVDAEGGVGVYSDPEIIWIPKEVLAMRAPAQAATPVQPSIQQPVSTVVTKSEPRSLGVDRFGVTLGVGVTNRTQSTSTTALTQVQFEDPYFQNQIQVDYESVGDQRVWAHRLDGSFSSFSKPTSKRTTSQPSGEAYSLNYQSRIFGVAAKSAETRWGWGIDATWDYRFEKSGLQSVNPSYGFSLGPAMTLMRRYSVRNSAWNPVEWGVELDAPLVGLALKSFWGLRGSLWAEWSLGTLSRNSSGPYSTEDTRTWLGIRPAFRFQWLNWKEPSGTRVVAWEFWLTAVLRWGSYF